MHYDPEQPMADHAWLSLQEEERISLVEEYHKKKGSHLPHLRMHAALQAVIETQAAENIPAVRDTLGRLIAEGLVRHEALHAIASVLVTHMYRLAQGENMVEHPEQNEVFYRELQKLSAEQWITPGRSE